jgi:hypothetical protein
MRATIRPALLLTAILLMLGLTAPAASASGRSQSGDRKRHQFAGHTQGRSSSDPDGMSNGGRDKPGFSGGFSADRDGNNGCGNDDDREDDNNGNCGRKKARAAAARQHKARVAGVQQAQDDDDRGKVKCETIFRLRAAKAFAGEKMVSVTVAGTALSLVFQPKVHALVFQPAAQAAMAIGLPTPQPAVKAAVEAVVQPAAAPVSQPAVVPAPSPPAEVATAPPAETAVLGAQLEQQAAPAVTPETEVAGAQESRLGALALTGLALGGLALLGAGLVAIGRLARGVGSA